MHVLICKLADTSVCPVLRTEITSNEMHLGSTGPPQQPRSDSTVHDEPLPPPTSGLFAGGGLQAGGGPGAGDMEKLHAECEQHKKAAHELAKVARTAKQEVNKPTHSLWTASFGDDIFPIMAIWLPNGVCIVPQLISLRTNEGSYRVQSLNRREHADIFSSQP
jgi:hypothetical protein